MGACSRRSQLLLDASDRLGRVQALRAGLTSQREPHDSGRTFVQLKMVWQR